MARVSNIGIPEVEKGQQFVCAIDFYYALSRIFSQVSESRAAAFRPPLTEVLLQNIANFLKNFCSFSKRTHTLSTELTNIKIFDLNYLCGLSFCQRATSTAGCCCQNSTICQEEEEIKKILQVIHVKSSVLAILLQYIGKYYIHGVSN